MSSASLSSNNYSLKDTESTKTCSHQGQQRFGIPNNAERSATLSALTDTFPCPLRRDCLDTRALAAAERQAGDDLLAYARNFESKIVSALEKDGAKLARMSVTEYKNAISSTSHVLNNEDLVHGKMQLSRFSKWLADYDQSRGAAPPRGARGKLPRGTISDFAESDAGGIEVPGQYGGFHRPDPGSHVTIVGFDQTLTCFSSIRRPKVLIIRGSDEKEYRFVVKGGEDLRLDQRIEQLFEVMNNALRVDPMCARRRLGVRTYG